jgi:hypothetical protein
MKVVGIRNATAIAVLLSVFALLAGCATTTGFEAFTHEAPPCKSAELSEAQVLQVAREVLGQDYEASPGMPEPNRRVTQFKCTYFYEQSLVSFDGRADGFDSFDCCIELYVSRDCEVFAANWSIRPRSSRGCPTMRSSGPRGEVSMFPDVSSARGRLTRRWASSGGPK